MTPKIPGDEPSQPLVQLDPTEVAALTTVELENAPLSDEQIEEITALLRDGRRLPPHLFPHLFEAPKEYELAYRGKAREVDVLSDTMAVPLQPVRAFGEPGADWTNKLVFGDNLQVLRQLIHLKATGGLRNPDGSDGVRVCYIDPPFATEREFRGTKGQVAYSDRVAGAEFVEALRRRLILIKELLTDDGTLYVHLDTKKGHYIKVVLDEIFGASNFRNEIIWWYYNKFQGNVNRFPSNHDVIYAYGKTAATYFKAVTEERASSSRLLQRVWDPVRKKLVNAKDEDGHVLYISKDDKRVDDVWRLPMLQPADRKERVDFPTQKPTTLASIILEASSRQGDIVLDAFAGSGTVAVTAERLGRKWIAIDSGKLAIYTTQARLLKVDSKPFTLYNAGLYDYMALRELRRKDYVEFVLQLFQCRVHRHSISGVTFDGHIADDPVIVYDFKSHPDARIGYDYVRDIASICKGRLGKRCFIIAPASAVEPYEDYVTVDSTRFFFLRVPYSIIAELHKRAFSDLRQARSEASTNTLVDSVGFDFIQPPAVVSTYSSDATTLHLRVESFESEAFASTISVENLSDLAMVLIDYQHDDDVFNISATYFADELKRSNWSITIPRKAVGPRLMIIYVDLHGNEYREVKELSDFKEPATASTSDQFDKLGALRETSGTSGDLR